MSKNTEQVWDVVVIGGGPAGMMAAVQASERGLGVLLVEKNETLGKKLLITGGGRCNVTNAELDNRKLLSKFKDNDKFLFSAFSQWSVQNTLDFFHLNNMPTKIENEQRVFPITDSAQSVWNVLVQQLKNNKVTILSNAPVSGFIQEDEVITGIKIGKGRIIKGKNFIVATGGKSRPETGSTGDGFLWLAELGHTIIEPDLALVPLVVKDEWISKLAGITLSNTKITVLQNNIKQEGRTGKILFTHVGVSGPTILNMSRDIGELLKYGEVTLSIDIMPDVNKENMDKKLQELVRGEMSNKKIKNALRTLFPSALSSIILEVAGIEEDTSCHSVTKPQRLKLVEKIKNFPLRVLKLQGVDKAIITSGGVDLPEVDFKTMRSRKYSNLYLIGDILNIDRPSGGYGLQLCWTTGFVAGTHVE